MLESIKVRSRLSLIVIAAFIGFLAIAAASVFNLRQTMLEDRKTKTRHLVEISIGVLEGFHAQEKAGKLPREEAQKQAAEVIRGLRYQGKEYYWINDMHPKMIMHPIRPEMEGTDLSEIKDKAGKRLFVEFAQVAKAQKAGFVDYMWARAQDSAPEPKVSYVQGFEPWGWVIGTGIYIDDVEAAFYAQIKTFAALLLGILAVVVALSYFVTRSILRQLGGEPAYAAQVMQEVAQGNLTVAVDVDRGSGASLLSTLATMLTSLRSMMQNVGNSANQVTGESGRIARASRDVAAAANTQSDATSSMAAAIEQMTVSISSISDSARETEANSAHAAELAGQGEARVNTAAAEIRKVADTVVGATEKIRSLGDRANEIVSIASVIKDIAAQTNLLALNAAIEAARAGEQGRGFAVVADEVRGLAERTAEATVKIEGMIGAIQAETVAAVDVMEKAGPQVQSGVDRAQGAADLLREIREGAAQTLERIREVASATQEQSSASDAIAGRVEQIAQMVEGTSASTTDTARSAERLEQLAAELNALIAKFRY